MSYKEALILVTMKQSEREAFQKNGSYKAPTGVFIHCSFAEQIEKVANAKLQGQNDLVLLAVDPKKLESESVVKYEQSTTWPGELFPHIYGPLNADAVVGEYPFQPDANGVFTLPKALSKPSKPPKTGLKHAR